MRIQAASMLLASLAAQPTLAATFDDEAAFLGAVTDDVHYDFEDSVFDSIAVDFGPGNAACSDDQLLCDTFFGNEFGTPFSALSGVKAIYFSPTATLTFLFEDAITAFGIFIGGAGDVGPQTLTATLSSGDAFDVLSDYVGGSATFSGNTTFFGVTSATAFTSVTLAGSVYGDGIFLDDMITSSAGIDAPAPVPLPASAPLLVGSLLGFATFARRRQS